MKAFLFLLVVYSSAFVNTNGEEVIKKMHERYAGKWITSFSFTQTTENYRNDSLVKTSTWYENIIYPDKFRIDFGDTTSGNAAIFTKDSIYSFRQGKLVKASLNDENLTFLLGGMFFYAFDTVKAVLVKMGFAINKSYETNDAHVIGASNADEKSKQLWIDKEKLVVIKFISYDNGSKEEGRFFNHKQFGTSWPETGAGFYVDGKLVQKETYFDCKANEIINPKIFDPYNFILTD